ncbi:MAG: hypothetical protein IT392_07720 [Nitrospirae bacterium]|nr:hypothetical protein [Nitrospirota bacterium]
MGPYIELGGGSGDWEYEGSQYNNWNDSTFNVDTRNAGIGFVLDTSPMDSSVFNYRLNVGLERHDIEFPSGGTIEFNGISVDNTFGISVVRNPNIRFWLGPQVRLAYYEGDRNDVDLKLVAFGIGPAAGVNFAMGPKTTISLSGGIRISGYAGQEEFLHYNAYYKSNEVTTSDINFSGGMVFFNMSVLFGR